MPGHEQFGSLPMYPRPSYRNSYSPHFQPRSQPGCIRVRVGGMPDLDSQEEAYVLVGFGHQPVTASMLLPHEDSALLLHHQWQTRLFEYDDDPAAHGSSSPVLSLEVMCWRPGSGEQSLGKTGIPAANIMTSVDGQRTLKGPLGLLVELTWLPPRRPGEADEILAGSGVRRVYGDDQEHPRASIWRDDFVPSPSKPISVSGVPPSSPPAHGKRWAWGSSQWHQVPIDQETYDASQRARARFQGGVEAVIEGMGIREERRAKSLAVSAVEAFATSSPKSPKSP